VIDSVVHTRGDWSRIRRAPVTRRGSGAAVRPPQVWVKRTQPSPVSTCRRSGMATAAKLIASLPIHTAVAPIRTPPSCPWPTSRSPSNSAHTRIRLANRKLAAGSSARSGRVAGGGVS
jgi:hypothetical protein